MLDAVMPELAVSVTRRGHLCIQVIRTEGFEHWINRFKFYRALPWPDRVSDDPVDRSMVLFIYKHPATAYLMRELFGKQHQAYLSELEAWLIEMPLLKCAINTYAISTLLPRTSFLRHASRIYHDDLKPIKDRSFDSQSSSRIIEVSRDGEASPTYFFKQQGLENHYELEAMLSREYQLLVGVSGAPAYTPVYWSAKKPVLIGILSRYDPDFLPFEEIICDWVQVAVPHEKITRDNATVHLEEALQKTFEKKAGPAVERLVTYLTRTFFAGLAQHLVSAYVQKEFDLHWGQIGVNRRTGMLWRLDFDHTTPVLQRSGETACSGLDYTYSAYDIKHFLNVRDAQPYNWPSTHLKKKSGLGDLGQEQHRVFQSGRYRRLLDLATSNPDFIEAYYYQFLKAALLPLNFLALNAHFIFTNPADQKNYLSYRTKQKALLQITLLQVPAFVARMKANPGYYMQLCREFIAYQKSAFLPTAKAALCFDRRGFKLEFIEFYQRIYAQACLTEIKTQLVTIAASLKESYANYVKVPLQFADLVRVAQVKLEALRVRARTLEEQHVRLRGHLMQTRDDFKNVTEQCDQAIKNALAKAVCMDLKMAIENTQWPRLPGSETQQLIDSTQRVPRLIAWLCDEINKLALTEYFTREQQAWHQFEATGVHTVYRRAQRHGWWHHPRVQASYQAFKNDWEFDATYKPSPR